MSNSKSSRVSIKGYEGLYSVTRDGEVYNEKRNAWLKPSLAPIGYQRVNLCKDGKTKTMYVHRIVATAFIPNPLNKKTVNHIDGIKSNNHVENLEWATYKENTAHAILHGLFNPRGKRKPYKRRTTMSKRGKAIRIIETGECYQSIRQCARAINGNFSDIAKCLRENSKKSHYRGLHFEYIDFNTP